MFEAMNLMCKGLRAVFRQGIDAGIEFLRSRFGDCLGMTLAGAILIVGSSGAREIAAFGYSMFFLGSAAAGIVIVSGGRKHVEES